MNVINFLYFSLYKFFYEFSQKKEMVPNGASLLLTMLFSTNVITCMFLLKFILPFKSLEYLPYRISLMLLMLLIFIFFRFFFKNYYVNNKNYVPVLEKIDRQYVDNIKLVRIFGFLYTVLTPIIFIVLATFLSNF